MSKQRSLTSRVSFTTLKDLPIAGKLLLLALVPLGITLVATLILTITGLNRLEAETGTAQLQEEVGIMGQQFSQLEANLKIITERLASDPSLLAAVQQGDKATLQATLLSNSIHSALDHLQIVDGEGQTLNVTQSFVLDDTPAELERLHKLGLLEIETTELVPTTAGWLLTVLRPLKTETGLVGTLSVGRLLDTSTLAELNFERTNPRLVLLDAQGHISVSSETNDQGNLKDAFEVNVNLWDQAKQGQVLLDQANIGGEVERVAYAPLVVGNKTAIVFGVLLSTAATINLRDQLVTITLIVVGVLTVLGTLSALGWGRKFIVRPIAALVAGAEQITAGQLDGVVPGVTYRDEIGQLATTFNNMTAQLRQTLESLENRTRSLEILMKISEHLVAILNLETLLAEVVNQIKDNFNYYHAHIYLLDKIKERLIVAEGTGFAGAEMKAKGHSIPLNAPASLVARAARTGEIVRVDNVREAEDWLPNPLLPNTYSEMAVPISLEGQVVGVLDVQQDKIAGLDDGDANLLRSLANQVAVAIRNARQFAEVEAALAEAHALQRRYLAESWDRTRVTRKSVGRVQFSLGESTTLGEGIIASAQQQALSHQKPAMVALNGQQDDPVIHYALVAPVMLRDVMIGDLQLHGIEPERAWAESELALINAVIDQVAQTAENLRLLDETQERASREQLVSQISNKMRHAPDMESLLKVAVAELARVLSPARTFVHLDAEATLRATPRELAGNGGSLPPEANQT